VTIEHDEILRLIPHRPPFLWIDRVEELDPGKHCVAVKLVDPGEAFFAGHFPARPILPGALLIEAVAQTAGVMLGAATQNSGGVALLGAVNRFKFLKAVLPGQQLRIETRTLTSLGSMSCISGTVTVDGETVATGELSVVAG
jgi:beta-hydroxyacyl-ACP dehydratase FabZ